MYIAAKEKHIKNERRQREEILTNLKLFYALEDEYTKEVAKLRTEQGATAYNKPESVKTQMRDKVRKSYPDSDFTYKPSKDTDYKKALDI